MTYNKDTHTIMTHETQWERHTAEQAMVVSSCCTEPHLDPIFRPRVGSMQDSQSVSHILGRHSCSQYKLKTVGKTNSKPLIYSMQQNLRMPRNKEKWHCRTEITTQSLPTNVLQLSISIVNCLQNMVVSNRQKRYGLVCCRC